VLFESLLTYSYYTLKRSISFPVFRYNVIITIIKGRVDSPASWHKKSCVNFMQKWRPSCLMRSDCVGILNSDFSWLACILPLKIMSCIRLSINILYDDYLVSRFSLYFVCCATWIEKDSLPSWKKSFHYFGSNGESSSMRWKMLSRFFCCMLPSHIIRFNVLKTKCRLNKR
jgi:hypothetical protein